MSLKVYRDGDKLFFGPEPVIGNEVPSGNWMLKFNPDSNQFYLEASRPFTYPERVYGSVVEDVKFYAEAYRTTNKNLGIILNGEKGSGKTLLTTLLCDELKLPVIMITAGFRGTEFVKFMDDIPNPVVVMVDEFDKIYSGDRVSSQTDLLRIMDAGNSNKKLFVLTSNRFTLSEFMVNRPSRIKYHQSFDKLTEDVIEGLLDDKLTEETRKFKDDFFEVTNVYGNFNLDSLLSLVEEVNRLKVSPKKAIRRMNMVPEEVNYEITLIENGTPFDSTSYTSDFDLLSDEFLPAIAFRDEDAGPSEKNDNRKGYRRVLQGVKVKDFDVNMNKKGFTLTHKTQKFTLAFERRKVQHYSYVDF